MSATEFVDERMTMRFDKTDHRGAVKIVPTDVATAPTGHMFWQKLHSLVRSIPAKSAYI